MKGSLATNHHIPVTYDRLSYELAITHSLATCVRVELASTQLLMHPSMSPRQPFQPMTQNALNRPTASPQPQHVYDASSGSKLSASSIADVPSSSPSIAASVPSCSPSGSQQQDQPPVKLQRIDSGAVRGDVKKFPSSLAPPLPPLSYASFDYFASARALVASFDSRESLIPEIPGTDCEPHMAPIPKTAYQMNKEQTPVRAGRARVLALDELFQSI